MEPHYAALKEVARVNREFYRAFERLDIAALRAVWLEDDRVKCIHPGGEVLVGIERVMASWTAIFTNTNWIRFEIADLEVELLGDVAWVTGLERIHAKPESEAGDTLIAEAVATNLYVRREGGWRMLLHHASPLARRFDDA